MNTSVSTPTYELYDNAVIWEPAGGCAHAAHDVLFQHWADVSGINGFLGGPITDQTVVNGRPSAYYNDFQYGSVYFNDIGNAPAEVHGMIRDTWRLPSSAWVGLPRSDEQGNPRGRDSVFDYGLIYWQPDFFVFGVQTQVARTFTMSRIIEAKWRNLGWVNTPWFEYPTTDNIFTADGKVEYVDFSEGSIYHSLASDVAYETHEPFRSKWLSLGGESGSLGLLTSNVYAADPNNTGWGYTSEMVNGVLRANYMGLFKISPAIYARWKDVRELVGLETGTPRPRPPAITWNTIARALRFTGRLRPAPGSCGARFERCTGRMVRATSWAIPSTTKVPPATAASSSTFRTSPSVLIPRRGPLSPRGNHVPPARSHVCPKRSSSAPSPFACDP